MKIQNLYSEVNVINLSSKSPPFLKGAGGDFFEEFENPPKSPFFKGGP